MFATSRWCMPESLPRHGVRLWCANCAAPATFILPDIVLQPGVTFATRAVRPCRICRGVDFQNSKRVIVTAADRGFLRSLRIAWEARQ